MADLDDYGISQAELETMYAEFLNGVSKSELERKYLGKPESHGKLFSSLVLRYLGIETEKRSPQSREVERLQRLVRSLGADPRRADPPLRMRSGADGATEFYGYGDFQVPGVNSRFRAIHSELIEQLASSPGARCEVTVEVRASAPQGFPPELERAVLGAAFEVGFSTAVFDSE